MRYVFVQNFIKLSAAVHEFTCPQRKGNKKNFAENNTGTVTIARNTHIKKNKKNIITKYAFLFYKIVCVYIR